MFCYNPDTNEVTDIGVAVSVIERRRYGYMFADAVVGRDGQIYFGEDDDLGHLWMYFPVIDEAAILTIRLPVSIATSSRFGLLSRRMSKRELM